MKDEIGGKTMTKFVGLKAKTLRYLIDHDNEDKKAKGTKFASQKENLNFENYKNCLEATQLNNE